MRFVLVLPLLLTGCLNKDRDTGVGGGGGGSGEGEGEGSSEGEGEGEGSAACPTYSGFHAKGNAWTYDLSSGSYSITLNEEISAFGSGTGGVVLDIDQTYHDTTYDIATAGTYSYTCASDGLYLEEVYLEISTSGSGFSYDSWTRSTYTDALVLPNDVSFGSSWEATWHVTTETDALGPEETTGNYWWVADDATETIDVEAGSFEALPIVERNQDTTSWVTEEVGTVRTDYSKLASYDQ